MQGLQTLQNSYQKQLSTNAQITQQLHQARGQAHLLAEQMAQRASGPAGVIESSLVEKVKPFNGERSSSKMWEFMLRSCLVSQNIAYRDLFMIADGNTDEQRNDDMAEEVDKTSPRSCTSC